MQFTQQAPQDTHGGKFCPFRGWLDEYGTWRDPEVATCYWEIAPYEAAIYDDWNGCNA